MINKNVFISSFFFLCSNVLFSPSIKYPEYEVGKLFLGQVHNIKMENKDVAKKAYYSFLREFKNHEGNPVVIKKLKRLIKQELDRALANIEPRSLNQDSIFYIQSLLEMVQ
jgi:hypothetical protein